MQVGKYETHGRKLMVEFKCCRCKTTELRPLEECMNETDGYHHALYDLRPPKEWEDGGFYYPLFCPNCAKAYEKFMNNEGGAE